MATFEATEGTPPFDWDWTGNPTYADKSGNQLNIKYSTVGEYEISLMGSGGHDTCLLIVYDPFGGER